VNNKLDYYIFVEELNKKIIKNIIKLKKQKLKINIIIISKKISEISIFARLNTIPFYVADNIKLAIKSRAKGIFLTSKNKILIDDKPETIDNWNNAGGIGILYKNTPDTLKQLKTLGL
jgi:hypothetical protein